MLPLVWKEQLKKNNIIIWAVVFSLLLLLYGMFDILSHGSFNVMIESLGITVFIVHMGLNLLMALMTSIMISLSQVKLKLTKTEPVGSNAIPVVSFVFALLTFGCVPCVVAFLAAVGIAFTPLVLPQGNLLWKIALLGFIFLSMIYILYSIHKGTCKTKIKQPQT